MVLAEAVGVAFWGGGLGELGVRVDFGGGKICMMLRRVGVSGGVAFFTRDLIWDNRFCE